MEGRTMTEPSGRIVAVVKDVRACGHPGEFQHYERDPYRAQRLAKFRRTRCPACAAAAAKAHEDNQKAASEKRKAAEKAKRAAEPKAKQPEQKSGP